MRRLNPGRIPSLQAFLLAALFSSAALFAGEKTEGPKEGPKEGSAASAPGDLAKALTGLDPGNVSLPVRAFVLLTVLSVVPSIFLLTTCFPRILIVLSFLRRALGTQDLPSNQILAGLTLILTALVMLPVWKRVHAEAYLPLVHGELKDTAEAVEKASMPIKRFMLSHTLEKDLRLCLELSSRGGKGSDESSQAGEEPSGDLPEKVESLSFFTVLPAFVLSELKLAFQMGFLLYLPFLIIDLTVSAILISMGMFMLPPVLVSLPLKVLVFVLADGWNLVVGQLVQGFQVMN
jgi:flagellar biosynthetic protein FliP